MFRMKRAVAFLLVLVMVFTCMPVSLATDGNDLLTDTVQNRTVQLITLKEPEPEATTEEPASPEMAEGGTEQPVNDSADNLSADDNPDAQAANDSADNLPAEENPELTCTLPGAQDVALSDVITELAIAADQEVETFMADIDSVSVSNEETIALTENDGDWTLRAVKEGEEPDSVTISMADGTEYNITTSSEGTTEISTADENTIISTVNDLYLPEEANIIAETLTEEQGEAVITAVQEVHEVPAEQAGYQVINIGLENVNEEEYEGFDVTVSLDEELTGKDFKLYQVTDGEATDITDTLQLDSETTETGLETVTGFSFTTDSSAHYVLAYTLETTYTAFDGETFKITLNYDSEAGIPENSSLNVTEILSEDKEYDDYLNDSAEQLGVSSEDVTFARFFDIEIQDENGNKVEPQKPVSVTIVLEDAPDASEDVNVIHFGEESTDVIASVTAENDEYTFEADSFSVYGLIVTNPPQNAYDLAGKSFIINRNSVYMTSEISSDTVNQFIKTTDANQATEWIFEATDQPGQYYILTMIDGEKKYMHLNRRDSNNAHAVLEDTPQAFTVVRNDNGTYTISTESKGVTYYLNEFRNQTGFAGWHQKDWQYDELVLNFTQPSLATDDTYAIIIHYEGNYYAVQNNGTLRLVESYLPEAGAINSVEFDETTMRWTYQTVGSVLGNGSGWNVFRHRSDAYTFDGVGLPLGFWYTYINPNIAEGIQSAKDDREEENRTTYQNVTEGSSLYYDVQNHRITGYNNNNLGVAREADGTLHIVGQKGTSDAAEVYLAKAVKVGDPTIRNNAVNHIDISVYGNAKITVPLAYGTYKLAVKDDQGNIQVVNKTLTVTDSNPYNAKAERMVNITQQDVKTGNFSAYTLYKGYKEELNDVFSVDGYTGNAQGSNETPQVRIQGTFKVSDVDPVPWYEDENSERVKGERLQKKIYYSLSLTKQVDFTLTYVDETDSNKEYIIMKDDSKPFTVNVAVEFSNTFTYWDLENECPGIDVAYGGRDAWQKGEIHENLEWYSGADARPGMDFRLGANDQEAADKNIVAIEVMKYVQGIDGTTVHTLSLLEGTDCLINVYQNGAKLHDKTLAVGTDGIGMIYDYDVVGGTYENPAYAQISEDAESVADEVIDAIGNKWVYDHSRVETEYTWRNFTHPSRHIGADVDKSITGGLFYSESEILGRYRSDSYATGGYDYNGKHYTGEEFNRFLEFYVYNIYKPEEIDVEITKTWDDDNDRDGLRLTPEQYKAKIKLWAGSTDITDKWTDKITVTDNQDGTYTVKASGMPKHQNGSVISYTMTEEAIDNYTVNTANAQGHQGGWTNTHEIEKTSIEVAKNWNDGNNQDGVRPTSISVQLYKDNATEGTAVTLNEDNSWTYEWKNLPKNRDKGTAIVYTVKELDSTGTAVADGGALDVNYTTGYSTSGNKVTITNTHVPEKTSINVEKVWNDNNNQDGKRLGSVDVQLYKDNEPEGTAVTLNAGNEWKKTWNDLPKYRDKGTLIVYDVKELNGTTAITDGGKLNDDYTTNYARNENAITITNTHIPEKTNIEVEKTWKDDDDRDGVRPASVNVRLYKDGVAEGPVVTLSTTNSWKKTWSNLEKYKNNGTEIIYTVQEIDGNNADIAEGGDLDANYKVTYTVQDSKVTITNTHTPEKTIIEVQKVWNDNNDQDGVRLNSVKVQLYKDDVAVDPAVTLDESNSWKNVWNELYKYRDNGTEIIYTVKELDSNNTAIAEGGNLDTNYKVTYTVQDNKIIVTNTHETEKTSIEAEKAWDDNNNQDGKRPSSVKVQLYKDNTAYGNVVTLDASNNWKKMWSNLEKFKNGRSVINYTVQELNSSNEPIENNEVLDDNYKAEYTVSGNKTTITNKHTPITISIGVEKIWDDNNNQDGKRPSTVTVQLYKDNVAQDVAVELNASNEWKKTWNDLPKYRNNGTEIVYTVKELDSDGAVVSEGGALGNYYTVGYEMTGNVIMITNTHTPEKTSVEVEKVWDDNNNQDGKRPNSVTVQLYKNTAAEGDPVILNDGNNWKNTWNNLDKYSSNGTLISYTVKELDQSNTLANLGYTAGYVKSGNKVMITNTRTTDKTSIEVEKVWDDGNNQDNVRPESVRVQLYEDNIAKGDPITLDDGNKWKYVWDDLTKNHDGGTAIIYDVKELDSEGKAVDNGGALNTNYTTTYTTVGKKVTVKNTHVPEITSVEVVKVWKDNNNQDGVRPASVSVQLYKDGVAEGAVVTLSSANSWTKEWDNLPKNRDRGTAIVYTVKELNDSNIALETGEKLDGNYTVSYVPDSNNKTTITNTHTPEKINIKVKKSWEDSNNQDGVQLDSVRVRLYIDNVAQDEIVILNSGNGWENEWKNLDKYKNNGTLIVYEVKELAENDAAVENNGKLNANYTVNYTTSDSGIIITNTHIPEKTSVEVEKSWNDNNNQDGKRPSSVTVQLYKDDAAEGTAVTLDTNNNWKKTWNDLDKYKEHGTLIVYTVKELNSTGTVVNEGGKLDDNYTVNYATQDNKTTITNTHTPEKTTIEFEKVWEDNENQDGVRPTELKVQLYKDNAAFGEVVTLSAADNWKKTWDGLDKYKNGKPIAYTVKELDSTGTAVADGGALDANYTSQYTVSGNKTTITNTHTPEKTSVEVEKVWDDNNNQDNVRPTSVKVQLYKDNVAEGAAIILNETNGWTNKWENLPKYRNSGTEIKYTVMELNGNSVAVADGESLNANYKVGYATSDGKITITNTHVPETRNIEVEKVWKDNNNQDGVRLANLSVRLYKDSVAEGAVVTLSSTNNWKKTWSNLPKYRDQGVEIVYTVKELDSAGQEVAGNSALDVNYTSGYSTDGDKLTITNTHTPETTKFYVEKVWEDKNDQDGIRPTSVKVQLYKDDVAEGNAVTLNAADSWKYTWNDLPKYRDGGILVVYTVKELDGNNAAIAEGGIMDENYTTGYTTNENKVTVTNTHVPGKTNYEIEKVWEDNNDQDGVRPANLNVQLYKDNVAEGVVITLNEVNDWKYTWSNLDKYKDNGALIVYSVKELDGTGTAVEDGGKLGLYYTSAYATTGNKTTITNTHIPEKTSIGVEKVWEDNDNQDGVRPSSVKVQLFKGNVAEGDVVILNGTNGWKHTWDNLEKYKGNGTLNAYNVMELDGDGTAIPEGSALDLNYTVDYLIVGDQITITNTHNPGKINIAVEKKWLDDNNQNGARPDSVTVQLYAGDTPVGTEVMLPVEKTDGTKEWKYTWTDLNEKHSGQTIAYTVKEVGESNGKVKFNGTEYFVELGGNAASGYTITNYKEPEKREIEPYKGTGLLGNVHVGDEITYEITYRNYKAEVADVIIKDTLDKNVAFVSANYDGSYVKADHQVVWTLEDVEAGKEGVVTLTVKVLPGALVSNGGGGSVINGGDTATVKVDNDSEFTLNTVENPVPEKKETSPYKGTGLLGNVHVGDEITYEISYRNYKTYKADVTIKDKLDSNVAFVSASNDGANSDGTVTWVLKDIEPGKSGTVTLTVKVLPDALVSNGGTGSVINGGNTATVKVDNDSEFTLNTVENPVPEKKETKPYEGTGLLGNVHVGDEITYEISYRNYKTEAATVTIKDKLDKNVSFVSASDGGTNQDGTVVWTLADVPSGKAGVVTLTVKVLPGALVSNGGTGSVINDGDTATVQVANDSEFKLNTVENPVPEKKETKPYEGTGLLGNVHVGDEITYEILYRNYKTYKTEVAIKDKLDKNVEFVSANNGGTNQDGTVVWTLKDVEPGKSGTVTLTVKVLPGALVSSGGTGSVINGGDTATVKVDNDSEFTLNTVENPVPEKKETKPYEGTGLLGNVHVGDEITYELSYRNYKTEAATVTIKDKLDKNVSFVSASDGGTNQDGTVVWTLADVPAGKAGVVTLTVKVLPGALVSNGGTGSVINDGDTATVQVGNDSEFKLNTVENPVPEKKETKPFEGTGLLRNVHVGDEITYEISYRNYKTEAATVTIKDKLDKNVSFVSASDGGTNNDGTVVWTLADVPAGKSGVVTLTVKVMPGALVSNGGTGSVINGGDTATVKVDNDSEFTLNTVENPVPEKKETSPYKGTGLLGFVHVGDEITYELSYRNYKTEAATVTIKDKLDKNVSFVSASGGGTNNNGTVVWTLADVPAGKSGVVTLTVKVLPGALVSNGGGGSVINDGDTATVQVGNDSEFTLNTVENPVPEKKETKPYQGTGLLGFVHVGDEITYEISYRNYKTEAATVTIKDKLDQNVSFVSASDGGTNQDGTVVWTLADVPAGKSGTVTLTVKVLPGALVSNGGTGSVINGGDTATVKVGNDSEFTLNTVENPLPEKKEIKPYEGNGLLGGVKVGDEITYEISYRNYKTEAATVTIKDKLDRNAEFVSASDGGTNQSGTAVWTLTDVPAGQAGKVTLTIKVLPGAQVSNGGPGKVINNGETATVKVGNDKEYTLNTAENPVPEEPEKKEIKPYEGNGVLGEVMVGDEITYEITYRNYKTEAADVVIKDKLDKNVSFVSASDGGANQYGTMVWALKAVPAGQEGKVTLTVKVLPGALASNGGPGKVINNGDTATVKVGNDKEFTLDTVENPIPDEPGKKEIKPYEGNGVLGAVQVGDEITYQIDFRNYKHEAVDVVIKDKLDKNVSFVSASDGGVLENGTVVWTLKAVPAGKESKVTLTVKVLPGALASNGGPGKVINNGKTATVKIGNDSEFTLDTVENPVPESPQKRETAPYTGTGVLGTLKPGAHITYEITYRNYKNEPADVVIRDTLDVNNKFLAASDGGSFENGVVVWRLRNVPAGTEGKVTVTVKVRIGAEKSRGGLGKVVNGGDNATVKVGNDKEFTLNVVENPLSKEPEKSETPADGEETVSVTVRKEWKDDNNKSGERPKKIRMTLNKDTVVWLSEENGWEATVEGLPKKAEDGTEITYTWTEQRISGYRQTDRETIGNVTTFTNAPYSIPEPPEGHKQPKKPRGGGYTEFDEYETALGIEVMINHVGDCFD